MITTKDKSGQTVYITYINDCGDNAGGFYCETYSDEDCGHKIDDFCIHPEDIPGLENMGWREQEAAIEGYIRNFYRDEVLDLDYNFHNF